VSDHEQLIKRSSILAVDDDELITRLLQNVLENDGYTNVRTTCQPSRALAMFAAVRPDLVLLDLRMSGMDGFELIDRMLALAVGPSAVPIIVLTGDTSSETRRRALSAGARDFLTKPLDRIELLLRVHNLLDIEQLQHQLRDQNRRLESIVAQRTRQLDQSRVEILDRLALAAEYRDDDTQEHARRIGRTCALIALALGLPDEEIEVIGRAAPLHDIGKIGVPDTILRKPGPLTASEFERIKTHPRIGAEILAGSRSTVLRLAEEIALSHHERWDGQGYPQGLSGEEIPLAGRMVAIADVFDALTHERPYKRAWPVDEALREIADQAGHQFDPAIADAFAGLDHTALHTGTGEWTPPHQDRPTFAGPSILRGPPSG